MKTKFGIVGCGSIAKRFASALNLSDSGDFYAAASRDISKAKNLINQYGGEKAYGSYDEMITDENVEIVYIAVVHNMHFEVAKKCIEHGKTVICEKPFFCSEKEGVHLAKLAKEKGCLIMEGMWTRCLPAFLKAKEWSANGSIGVVKLINAEFCFYTPLTPETEKHRLYNPDTAGGALLDVGVYPYEFITGILGEKPIEVRAVTQLAATGVDETVGMCLKFASGVIANAQTSIGVRTSNCACIYGTDGFIKISDFYAAKKCEMYNDREELIDSFEDDEKEGFVYEIEHIIDLYKEGSMDSMFIPIEDSIDFARTADIIRKQVEK